MCICTRVCNIFVSCSNTVVDNNIIVIVIITIAIIIIFKKEVLKFIAAIYIYIYNIYILHITYIIYNI